MADSSSPFICPRLTQALITFKTHLIEFLSGWLQQLTPNSSETELWISALWSQYITRNNTQLVSRHLTPPTLLATKAAYIINIPHFVITSRLSLDPAVITFVNSLYLTLLWLQRTWLSSALCASEQCTQGLNWGGSRWISDPAPLAWDPLPLITDPVPHIWDRAPFCWDLPLCTVYIWSAVGNPTSAFSPSGSSFGPWPFNPRACRDPPPLAE